jgi:hypothetical protein
LSRSYAAIQFVCAAADEGFDKASARVPRQTPVTGV